MIDIGEFVPTAVLGPSRSASGTVLGREATTEEQRHEAVERLVEAAREHREKEAKATVIWSRGEPTVIELSMNIEHINGQRVWLPGDMVEMTVSGAELQHNEPTRLRILTDEINDLHERGML